MKLRENMRSVEIIKNYYTNKKKQSNEGKKGQIANTLAYCKCSGKIGAEVPVGAVEVVDTSHPNRFKSAFVSCYYTY